jgi:peptidase E
MVVEEMMLEIALTSDFPSTGTQGVLDLMRKGDPCPRIAWVPPYTQMGRERFPAAQQVFAAYGFSELEYCDIDQAPNFEQLARLDQYDVIYLTGGDPIGFRHNMLRTASYTRLRQYLATGHLIVAASGGTMQFTKNVSLFRLLSTSLDEVIATHSEYEAAGIVTYEILPHLNRHAPSFLELVRRYSEHVAHDVLGLADGAALLYKKSDNYTCLGRVVRFRKGVASEIGESA